MKVLHIIPSLGQGGAERSLLNYLEGSDEDPKDEPVLLISSKEFYLQHNIYDKNKRIFAAIFSTKIGILAQLVREIYLNPPQVIMCWMYHSMVIGWLIKLLLAISGKKVQIYWNFRQCFSAWNREKFFTRLVILFLKLIQRFASGFIFNSESAKFSHESIGFSNSKVIVLNNQFDYHRFCRLDLENIKKIKNRLGLSHDSKLICHVGRLHTIKNHRMFLRVISDLLKSEKDIDFHVVLIGEDVSGENIQFRSLLSEFDLLVEPRIHALGIQPRVELFIGSSALYVQTSDSESYPNALCEAMLCENVVVATDVGATREIVGSTNFLIGPGCDDELKAGILWALHLSESEVKNIGAQNRRSIIKETSSGEGKNRIRTFMFTGGRF